MANVPTLLLVLVELTGDRRWLAERYRVRGGRGVNDNDTGGFEPDVQHEVRRAAVEAIGMLRFSRGPGQVAANVAMACEDALFAARKSTGRQNT